MTRDTQQHNQCRFSDSLEEIRGNLPGDVAFRRCGNRRVSLKRTLGLTGVFSIAYGNLGSTVYFALGVIALHALGATPLIILMAALFFLFTAMSYAEGTAAIPEAGGSSSFARKGFNEMVSFVSAWCLLLGYAAATAVAAFSAISYLGSLDFFSFLEVPGWNFAATGILLLTLMIINIVGIRESSILSIFFAVIDVITQLFIVLVGSLFFLNIPKILSRIHWGIAPTWPQLAMALYLVMISFTGIETVSNLAEESKEPQRTIPRSMWWSVGIIVLLFFGLANVSMGAMPVGYQLEGYVYTLSENDSDVTNERDPLQLVCYPDISPESPGMPVRDALVSVGNHYTRTDESGHFILPGIDSGTRTLFIRKSGYHMDPVTFDTSKPMVEPFTGRWTTELSDRWINAPISGVVSKLPFFRDFLGPWVAILAFTILVVATNAGMLGFSRLVFSMGSYRQLPPFLARIHPRFRTPWVAIIIFTLAAFLIIMTGRIEKMAEVYAFAAMISYTIAHVSIIAMRIRHPDLERPYRIPLNLALGLWKIPVTSIIGSLACFALWVVVLLRQDFGRSVGIPFILTGILIYAVYRRSLGLSLTETVDESKRM